MSKSMMSVTRSGKVEQREIAYIRDLGLRWADSGKPAPMNYLPYPVHGLGEVVVQTMSGETFIVDGVP